MDTLNPETPYYSLSLFWNNVYHNKLTMFIQYADGSASSHFPFDPFRMFDCTNLVTKLFPEATKKIIQPGLLRSRVGLSPLEKVKASLPYAPLYPLNEGDHFVVVLPAGLYWGYESTKTELLVLPQYIAAIQKLFVISINKAVLSSIVGPSQSGKTLFGLFLIAVIQRINVILSNAEAPVGNPRIGYHKVCPLGGRNPLKTYFLEFNDKIPSVPKVTADIIEDLQVHNSRYYIPLVLISDDVSVIPFAQQLYLFMARDDNPCLEQHEAQVSRSGSRGYPVVRLEFPALSQEQRAIIDMLGIR